MSAHVGREGGREAGRYLQTRLPQASFGKGVHIDVEADQVGWE